MDKQEIKNIAMSVYNQMQQQGQYTSLQTNKHTHDGISSPQLNARNIIPNNKYIGFVVGSTPAGSSTTSILNITGGIYNPSSVSFYGIAYYIQSDTSSVTFTGDPSAGATSGTLTASWTGPTGVWSGTFHNGEQRQVSLTNGSTAVTWSSGLVVTQTTASLFVQYTVTPYKAVINGNAQLGNCFQETNTSQTSTPINTNIIQTNTSSFFDNTSGAWVPSVSVDILYLGSVYVTGGILTATVAVTSWSNTQITLTSNIPTGWVIEGSIVIT